MRSKNVIYLDVEFLELDPKIKYFIEQHNKCVNISCAIISLQVKKIAVVAGGTTAYLTDRSMPPTAT